MHPPPALRPGGLIVCGIAGFVDPKSGAAEPELDDLARQMAGRLAHRGPDDWGTWVDAPAGVALGHRRLAILDLSPQGHQPMVSKDGRYVLTFNGEIYNYRRLRDELMARGHRFSGTSDTEVLLAAWVEWGVHAIDRCNGMFAFALWDRNERALHLARDPLGEKPLYYGWLDGSFLFASQLVALHAHPRFRDSASIDREALDLYVRFNYVPSSHSIYRGIQKLPPGTILTIRHDDGYQRTRPQRYWSLARVVDDARRRPATVSDEDAADELHDRLSEAVALRMHADVPLGAFLSGGIDSSTVVALMQAHGGRRVRTFTVGFGEPTVDESEPARAVASHLGTEHTEVQLSPTAALEAVPTLPDAYDEPFADPSQLPMLLIARVARQHVTVSLSGDGADEMFGGYNRYVFGRTLWRATRHLPTGARRLAGRLLLTARPESWDRLLRRAGPSLPVVGRVRNPGEKVQKLSKALAARTEEDLYWSLISQWDASETLVLDGHPPELRLPSIPPALEDVAEKLMFIDALLALPDEMLTKVDRATMAVGLETRVPFLDPTLVEFAWTLPLGMRIRDGRGKWLLRQVLQRYVPQELVDRPKAGFDPPIGAWLRGPLRDWAEALLHPSRLRNQGYFRWDAIHQRWNEHLTRRRNWDYELWSVLMFQAWLERQEL